MLSRLILTDFRNHAELVLAPAPGFVVLTGENGAGKTNVLEAVSLLSPGRGLRRAALSAMQRQDGPGGFGIAATLALPDGAVEIATGTLAATPERRQLRIQGAAATANTLAEWLTVLWLTPAMDRLFVEPAGERRRFLDRLTLALVPAHAQHAARYEAAMRARTRLLTADEPADPQWLSALEAQMAQHGAALDAARRETVAALGERLAEQPDGPFARAALLLEGWSGTADALLADLRHGRARDAAAGRALAGPHRADLAVTHLGKGQAAALASTGEQKALLLGIVLAHAELVASRTGHAPILLLDEVAAHLDPLRRAALFDRLAGHGQVWMTGTEPALFAAIGADATRIALG
ncbi:DNA replication/repair protein RecF [Arthrobacter sp. TPD3018]|uniref:DNA replication/repair protein RecF n=1 Tax=Bacteria TaxID=2 RepID=UPI000D519872|nr:MULTISPECIES: DNA replication/repair protein RecF [Bacteria]PVE59418.1 DNA replication/repair protein RecF [Sphingomonas sp. TPD3009]PVE60938.1 DNA replication/repair protein RecF [Arthrobacter sp. TPD3018]PVE87618.1 DNA replication/repair protein RecF [Sphingomonas melonis]